MARRHRQLRRPREPSIKMAVVTESQTQFDVDALLGQHSHPHLADDDDEALLMDAVVVDPMMMADRFYGPYRRRKTDKRKSYPGKADDSASTSIPRQNDRFKAILDSIQRSVRDAVDRKFDIYIYIVKR